MNRAANEGFKFMANIDTLPLYGMQESSGSFRSVVAKAAGVQEDEGARRRPESVCAHTRALASARKNEFILARGWTISAACLVCSRAFWQRVSPAACRFLRIR